MKKLTFDTLSRDTFGFAKDHFKHAAVLGLPGLILSMLSALIIAQSPDMSSVGMMFFILGLLSFLATVYAQYGLVSHALGRDEAVLTFGPGHVRLLGANLLYMILLAMVTLVAVGSLMFVGLAGAMGAAGMTISGAEAAIPNMGAGSALLILLVILACFAGVIWFAIRLAAFPAATVAQERMHLLSSFPLTKGQFGPILMTSIVMLLAIFLASIVLVTPLEILFPVAEDALETTMPDGNDFQAVLNMINDVSGPPIKIFLSSVMDWIVTYIVAAPLFAGLSAAIYRHMDGDTVMAELEANKPDTE